MMKKAESKSKKGAEKPISLYPLSFEETMKAMLKTPPPPKEEKKEKEKKKKAG